MLKHILKNIVFLMSTLMLHSLFAGTINVPGDYGSIQQAINAAQPGDTVLVDAGVYYENINFNGKEIVVCSKFALDGDVSHIIDTVIDGSQPAIADSGSCVAFVSGEDTSAVIQGFTLTGGTGTMYQASNGNKLPEGGAIILINSSATIKNNLIINNEAKPAPGTTIGGGGGISSFPDGTPRILNNVVMLNKASYAGGIVLNSSGGIIKNNIIYCNAATGTRFGTGGIQVGNSPLWSAVVENNTIVGNTSPSVAGAILVNRTQATIKNNIIWGNRQARGKQVTGINGSIFEFCDTEEDYNGTGNFSSYPTFLAQNFLPETNSPCIDAGAPETAYNDKENPSQAGEALFPSLGMLTNDIGAYGGFGAEAMPFFSHELIYAPAQRQFFPTTVNDSRTISVEIINLSSMDATIDSITVPAINGLSIDKNHLSTLFKPMQGDTIDITWKPTQAGSMEDTLKIYHNLSSIASPMFLVITGTATFPTDIHEKNSTDAMPSEFRLFQNYPNPFNPETLIRYSIPEAGQVKLAIYNMLGQHISELVNAVQEAGQHQIKWRGLDYDGIKVSSGNYYYRLEVNGKNLIGKMSLLK